MSREKERIDASFNYTMSIMPNVIGGSALLTEEEYINFNRNSTFEAGAIWSDKTLIEKAHKWISEHVAEATGIDSVALIESFDEFIEN